MITDQRVVVVRIILADLEGCIAKVEGTQEFLHLPSSIVSIYKLTKGMSLKLLISHSLGNGDKYEVMDII